MFYPLKGGTKSVSIRFEEGTNVTSASAVPATELDNELYEAIQEGYKDRVLEVSEGQPKREPNQNSW